MNEEIMKALVAKYKRIQKEKRDAERQKKIDKKKEEKRGEVLKRKSKRRAEQRRVVMYRLHLKRLKKAWKKMNTKERRRRAQHKYYMTHIRRPKLRRRLHKGDENGVFVIFFARNKEYYKKYAHYRWKFNTVDKYNKLITENREKSICPVVVENGKPVKYEILIKKLINPEEEKNESSFRDDMGSVILVKTDNPNWIIFAKENWYFEETFYLYGYHPVYDRKTAGWIIENIIKRDIENGLSRIFLWKSYVFFENEDDFTFLLASSHKEAIRLYNILYDRLFERSFIFFTGELSKLSVPLWIEKMKEKTGWLESTIKNCKPIF